MQWYIRHHYAFFSSWKRAGYVRFDPLDPQDATPTSRVWSDPLHSDYSTHTGNLHHDYNNDNNDNHNANNNNDNDNNNNNDNNNDEKFPVSRVNIRNEGILRLSLSEPLSGPLSFEPLSLCDTVLSPPWSPIVIFMPSLYTSSSSFSSSSVNPVTPVFAEPFALLDVINQGLVTDGDILVVALEAGPGLGPESGGPGLEPGQSQGQSQGSGSGQRQGSGSGLQWSGEVVIASPGASMAVLRETLLATQGLDLGPDQKQGLGLGPGSDASVSRASLPAHQWRSVCAMLQLHQRHPQHAWDEGKASVPGEIT